MIIDYPGQEIIWNLTATHPYEQNRGNYSIMIRCQTPKQNKEYVRFFRRHIKKKLMTVETEKYIDIEKLSKCSYVKKISVPDALDGVGEVKFINEFIEGV